MTRFEPMTRRQATCLLAGLPAQALATQTLDQPLALHTAARHLLLARLERVMGPLPALPATPPAVTVLSEERFQQFTRYRIEYEAEPGDSVPAFLLAPHRPAVGLPAMLCLHQTTSIGKAEPAGLGPKPNLHYAKELAERGHLTLAPDYPNFGDYRVDVYARGYASASMKGIVNHLRAVDLLAAHPAADSRRIGVIGHSLGGHNSLFAAAFDQRLRAVVTSCGFNSFAKYYGGNLTGWSHKGYMPRIASLYDRDPARMPFDFSHVLAAIAPRSVFINAPLRDANFEVSGVRDSVAAVAGLFPAGRLVSEYPDAGHDFPPEVRERAYRFLETALRA